MAEAADAGGDQERKWAITKKVFMEELKKESSIAAPMVAVSVLQYLLQVASVIMVGHLGKLHLSSVAIATSLTNVTGFSLLSGMAGGLETLCGQAYGARQYEKLGTYTYTAIISLLSVCPPICLLWTFMNKLLLLIGQDPLTSHQASKYSMWLIPALFGSAILKPLTRFLQTQSVIFPMLISSVFVLCFHVVACWSLVYKVEMGIVGSALAFGLSTWLNVTILVIYIKYSSVCEKTRSALSREAFHGVRQFFRIAVPSAVMVCLKWWSMEVITLLSGLLPNPELETSVLSICTRVSNELGSGNPQSARLAVLVAMCIASIEAIVISTIVFSCRHVLGYAYSIDKQVVSYVVIMAPFLSLPFHG